MTRKLWRGFVSAWHAADVYGWHGNELIRAWEFGTVRAVQVGTGCAGAGAAGLAGACRSGQCRARFYPARMAHMFVYEMVNLCTDGCGTC